MAETPRPPESPPPPTADGELHRDPRHPGMDEIRYPDGQIEHPHVRSERTDVTLRSVVIALLIAMGFAACVHWIVLEFFYSYRGYQQAIKKSPFPVAPSPADLEKPDRIPEPRLEPVDRMAGNEKANVFERQLRKEQELHHYGPTDESGYVHIPIERAMERLANQLPHRKETGKNRDKENGLVDAGESNSGRMFRGKGK